MFVLAMRNLTQNLSSKLRWSSSRRWTLCLTFAYLIILLFIQHFVLTNFYIPVTLLGWGNKKGSNTWVLPSHSWQQTLLLFNRVEDSWTWLCTFGTVKERTEKGYSPRQKQTCWRKHQLHTHVLNLFLLFTMCTIGFFFPPCGYLHLSAVEEIIFKTKNFILSLMLVCIAC